jgi:hypothetical protein
MLLLRKKMDSDLVRLNEIDRRIADIRRQLADHELEVQDVLACVDTPESSDVEGEEVDEPEVADSRGDLFRVEALPQRETAYSPLYSQPQYKEKAERKVRLMKEEVRKNYVSVILLNPEFPIILDDIRAQYPDDGGRIFINSLVACHIILNS